MTEAPTRFTITRTFEQAAAALAERMGDACAAVPGSDADPADALRPCLAEALNVLAAHARAGAPNGCEVLLSDNGAPMPAGFPPAAAIDIDPSDPATLPEGGFGWSLNRARLDAARYGRQNRRNRLRLARLLRSAPGGPLRPATAAPGSTS